MEDLLKDDSLTSLSISPQQEDNLKDKQCIVCQEKVGNIAMADRQSAEHNCLDHHNSDWKNKKQVCQPFIIKETEDMGIGWFATRDLEPGCILLEELPAIQAPGWQWSTKAGRRGRRCLVCGVKMKHNNNRTCSICFWPVCSDACEKNPIHMDNECKELLSRNFKYPPPPTWPTGMFIMCLRANVMKTCDPEKFGQLMALKDSNSIPSSNQELQNYDLPAGMLDVLKGPNCLDHDEFRKLLRIYSVNSFGSNNRPGSKNTSYLIYLKVSRINNSCFPNCAFTFEPAPTFKIRVCTTVPIAIGEQITINYYEQWTALPTSDRQQITNDAGFICKCKKCLDPTELGSFVSGIKCFDCSSHLKADSESDLGSDATSNKVGFLVPADPLEKSSDNRVYECHRCHIKHPFGKVMKTLPIAVQNAFLSSERLIDSSPADLEALESLLQRYEGGRDFKDHLHRNHWLIQAVTRRLISKQKNFLENMTEQELKRLMGRLEFLLKIDDQLYPGLHVARCDDFRILEHVGSFLKQKFGHQMDLEEVEELNRTIRKTQEELPKFANLGYRF